MKCLLSWDINPIAFTIPFTSFSVHWYGVLFATGFFLGYLWVTLYFKKNSLSTKDLDTLLSFMFLGTIIGARLGHCFFYDPDYYLSNPLSIFKIWEGGLASHGGGIGLILSVLLFCKIFKYSFWELADILCIPTAFVGSMIRIGNFFNSEIYGKIVNSELGELFSVNFLRIDNNCRHPVQLYESITYFLIFSILLSLLYLFKKRFYKGLNLGLFLVLIFISRFFLEFFKPEQASYNNDSNVITVGQYLSIPFVIVGIVIIFTSLYRKKLNKLI